MIISKNRIINTLKSAYDYIGDLECELIKNKIELPKISDNVSVHPVITLMKLIDDLKGE